MKWLLHLLSVLVLNSNPSSPFSATSPPLSVSVVFCRKTECATIFYLSPYVAHGQQAANHFSSLFLSVSVKPKERALSSLFLFISFGL
jgi:uncharacterized membrane protein YdjX (TVP38/TMEM64 family)